MIEKALITKLNSDNMAKFSPQVAIVIVNYNGIEDTLKCLDSLFALKYDNKFVVVVDNGSSSPAHDDILSAHPWVVMERSATNEGWAGGNNIGIRNALNAGVEFVILLNNDTVVSSDLVSRLVDAAQANPEFGIIGPVINEMSHPDQVQTDGCLFNRPESAGFFQRKVVPLRTPSSPLGVTEVDIVNGCCMMISRQVFERIGFIDEQFFLIHEESDYCLRAREHGFRCGVIGESLVWHKHSASFARAGNWRQRYYEVRNLYLLLRKHPPTSCSRSSVKSWLTYAQHLYYCYCIEREQHSEQGARAVVQGFCDALYGRFGPQVPRASFIYRLVHGVFETAWICRGRRAGLGNSTGKGLDNSGSRASRPSSKMDEKKQ